MDQAPPADENCILRIHVPFPAGRGSQMEKSDSHRRLEEWLWRKGWSRMPLTDLYAKATMFGQALSKVCVKRCGPLRVEMRC